MSHHVGMWADLYDPLGTGAQLENGQPTGRAEEIISASCDPNHHPRSEASSTQHNTKRAQLAQATHSMGQTQHRVTGVKSWARFARSSGSWCGPYQPWLRAWLRPPYQSVAFFAISAAQVTITAPLAVVDSPLGYVAVFVSRWLFVLGVPWLRRRCASACRRAPLRCCLSSHVHPPFTATVSAWLRVGRAGVCVQVIIGGVDVFSHARSRPAALRRCVPPFSCSCCLGLRVHGVSLRLCGVALFGRGQCAVAGPCWRLCAGDHRWR